MDSIEPFVGLSILLGWVVVLVVVAWLSTKYRKLSVVDFATTGGTLGILTLFLTYSATYHSAYAFMGTTGAIYTDGLAWWDNVHWVVLPPILMWFIGSRVWVLSKKYNLISFGDYVRTVYRSGGKATTIGLNLIVSFTGFFYVLLYTAIQGLGIAYLFTMITRGMISTEIGLAIFVLLNIFITWVGGMRGVAWTDAVQGIFMLVSYLAASVAIPTIALGGLLNAFEKATREIPQWLYLPGPRGLYTPQYWLSLWITITLGMVIMPHVWIRYYAGKSLRVMKWSSVFSAMYLTYLYLFTPALGLTGKSLYPKYPVPDRLVPEMLLTYTPFAFAAFVMAGALAAALSTSDSQLHAVATILAVDIYKPYIDPKADERKLYDIERWLVLILGAIVAYICFARPALFITILAMATGGTCALFPIFVLPLFWHRANSKAALIGAIIGEIVVALTTFAYPNPLGVVSGVWGLIATLIPFVVVSLVTKPEASVAEVLDLLNKVFH